MDAEKTVMQWMSEGGWVMWALLVMSVVALAVAIERAFALRRAQGDFESFFEPLRRALVDRHSMAEAREITEAASGPVAAVAEAGLRRMTRSTAQLEKSLERRCQGEIRRLHRGLGILATVAGTAPLLGFLGTVTGMMVAFQALADFGTSNPAMVALGIKEALTTTAAGLVVAVPAQLAHNALAGRVERIVGEIEDVANFLLEVREELA